MANMQAGLQGAQTGAQIGSNFGGMGTAIGGIVGGLAGLFTPDYAEKQMKAYNAQVLKFTHQAIFDLQRNQAINNMRTAEALASYQDTAKAGKSSYNAAYGAAEIIGSSAEALKNTIDYEAQQATAREWQNFEIGVDNFNTQLSSIVNSGINSFQTSKEGGAQMDIASLVGQGIQGYKDYKTFKSKGGSVTQEFKTLGSNVSQAAAGFKTSLSGLFSGGK